MCPLMTVMVPNLLYLPGNASLEIFKRAFINPCRDWVLGCGDRLVMILDVTWVKVRVIELGITKDTA